MWKGGGKVKGEAGGRSVKRQREGSEKVQERAVGVSERQLRARQLRRRTAGGHAVGAVPVQRGETITTRRRNNARGGGGTIKRRRAGLTREERQQRGQDLGGTSVDKVKKR